MTSISRLVGLASFFVASLAAAQCTKDIECKGDRVCSRGACVSPSAVEPAPAATVAPPPPPPAAEPAAIAAGDDYEPQWATASRGRGDGRRHWAGGASVLGYTAGVLTGVLTVTATIIAFAGWSSSAAIFALPFAGTAVLLMAISAPMVAAGAGSARYFPALTGAPGARVAGWVLVALGLASGVLGMVMTPIGYSGGVVGFISFATCAVTGTIGMVLLAADAAKSAGDAPIAPRRRRTALEVAPSLGLARQGDGTLLPTLALAGRF